MKKNPRYKVEVGQHWEDCNKRTSGRRLVIESVTNTIAVATVIGNKTRRVTRIHLYRMYEHPTGYRLVSPDPTQVKVPTVGGYADPEPEPFED